MKFKIFWRQPLLSTSIRVWSRSIHIDKALSFVTDLIHPILNLAPPVGMWLHLQAVNHSLTPKWRKRASLEHTASSQEVGMSKTAGQNFIWAIITDSICNHCTKPIDIVLGRESRPVSRAGFKTVGGRQTVPVGSTPTLFRQYFHWTFVIKLSFSMSKSAPKLRHPHVTIVVFW